MSKHIVIGKQNVLDIALMRHGHIDAVFELIANNEISLHEPVAPNTVITYSDSAESIADEDVLAYYKKNKIEPVTDVDVFESESRWILRTGFWDDNGVWEDHANWIDSL